MMSVESEQWPPVLLISEPGSLQEWGAVQSDVHKLLLDFSAAGEDCEARQGIASPGEFQLGIQWQQIRARYAPFVLVRTMFEYLLAQQPRYVVVERLSGAALELARLAHTLGFEVALRLPEFERVDPSDETAMRWLRGMLTAARWLLPARAPADEAALRLYIADLRQTADAMPGEDMPVAGSTSFGYEAYALGRRDHGLLFDMQAGFASLFAGCERVLDIGSGTGVFAEVLARREIDCLGVDRNPMSVRFARSLEQDVICQDALEYLESSTDTFDAVYCSHFIEHLPVDAAERLLRGVARVLRENGVAVFVFPDPESIRSQLLGFWRDPEHVRFYHPELVELLASMAGLSLMTSSLDSPGRRVVPFRLDPPLPEVSPVSEKGLWARVRRRLGIAGSAELAAERARADALEGALRQLWDVNQTWAWSDNAVLCFRKRLRGSLPQV